MTKFRVRLTNGRVIGPFAKEQLFELKAKGHIHGNEEAQVYPTGNWEAMSRLEFYSELMSENLDADTSMKEETFVIDLSALRRKQQEKDLEELGDGAAPAKNLTETIRLSPSQVNLNLAKTSSLPQEATKNIKMADVAREDKTQINPLAQEELRRLRVKQQEQIAEEEERRLRALKKEQESRQAEEPAPELLPEVSPHESTQVVSLDKLKGDLLDLAEAQELDIEEELKHHQLQNRTEEDEEEEIVEDEEEDASPLAKKKKILYVLGALVLAYALLFPGEDKSENLKPLQPLIVFPIPYDKADATASKALYRKGVETFAKGTYPAIVISGKDFKNSYENDMSNMPALSFMVRSYGEQLTYSRNLTTDALTVFNVVQSKRPSLIQDPNGVIGMNRFYMAIDKTDAAIDVVSKYLKLYPKKITQDLFAAYLHSLVIGGKVDLARQFFTALEKAPDKNQYALEALIEYLQLNEENEKADAYLEDALLKFPKLARFQLMKAENLIKDQNAKEAAKYLTAAKEVNLENNQDYLGKYFELLGMIAAIEGKVPEATKLIAASLKVKDSPALRLKLASLEASPSATEASKLIEESRAYKFMKEAQAFYNNKSYELALVSIARAVDASQGYMPASLFLSKVQLKLGHTKQGLKTLEDLAQRFPSSKAVNVALIESYIDTFKFNDARSRLAIISGSELRQTWEYASLNGRLALKMNDSLKAVSWLKTSMNLNPLNDRDIALLAETMFKRSNFENARLLLNRAIELDPVNPDYRILYAKLIYETQDDQAAIGYLLGLLDEFGENPKVLSEIAISYFRAGKVKDFQDFKARIEKLPTKDKALYEFLIKAAILDERYLEVPGLVEELLKIEPGSLEHMMTAGKILFESGELVESAKWFLRIKERMPSYPKVQYYGARIKFLSGDMEGALKEVQEDVKANGENDATLVFMAEIFLAKGELVAAENYYKKAQKLNPRSYDAIMGLADLSTKRNNYDLALDLYKKAMKQRSDEPIVHKKVGDVYRLLGQGTLAIEAYRLYLEMNPEAADKKQIESYIQLMQ
jgi:tetratricopeptide (TPR) repeat protein